MQTRIHQTHHSLADFAEVFKTLKAAAETGESGIHIFPELFLTGYPLQDLCLQKPFIQAYLELLQDINAWSCSLKPSDFAFLLGGIDYRIDEQSLPLSLENVVYLLEPGKPLSAVYSKQLLPNYDIFDELKYFTPGDRPGIVNVLGKTLGVLICEDMWSSSFYRQDPVERLKEEVEKQGLRLDAVVNLSASPFNVGKKEKRMERGHNISDLFQAPFIYVNRVGGEDELLFDGNSFVAFNGALPLQLAGFQSDSGSFELPPASSSKPQKTKNWAGPSPNTWEELFQARICPDTRRLRKLTEAELEDILQAICFGFQEYARKSGFSRFTLALSGGMDSALALTLMRLSLKEGQYLEAIYMPSAHSASLSYDCSLELCQNLGVPLKSLPIKFLHSAVKNLFGANFQEPFEGLTDENIQSRLRGTLIYTRSNQIGSMVVNTSNKSELAVGYSTQYGDSVGAISLLGDLYKSEVYELAEHINKTRNGLIPEAIIKRPPSAELRPDQEDGQSLPPYDRLDAILEGILSYRYGLEELTALGLPKDEVLKTLNLYRHSEFKRRQFCPILKISSKSFGFGYRIPLSKASDFYVKSEGEKAT